jgi:hypothetical protein
MSNREEVWNRRSRIVLSEGPVDLNTFGFGKVIMTDGNGDPFELGLTGCRIHRLPRATNLEEYYRFPLELDVKQKGHLEEIYSQIQSQNTWFRKNESVHWQEISDSVQLKWPVVYGDLSSTGFLPINFNGDEMQMKTTDFVARMYQKDPATGLTIRDHRISRVVVEVKPWIRRGQDTSYEGGLTFALKRLEIVV